MDRTTVLVATLLSVALLAASGGAAAASKNPGLPTVRPALAVLIVVDQLRGDDVDRFAPRLDGGLARLQRDGLVFTNAHFDFGLTETGPGHAALATGRPPATNGILANVWFDRGSRQRLNCVADPRFPSFSGKSGASPHNLESTGIADWLKAASPSSRVVSVAGKDRSAILLAGKHPDAALWYEPSTGRFTTSRYYSASEPPVLARFNEAHPLSSLACTRWERLGGGGDLPEAGPDAGICEPASDRLFPHLLPCAEARLASAVREFPHFDDLTLDLAEAAVERYELGRDDAPDLLALGLSATDYVGHKYGPDSQEMLDQIRRLDRRLGQFLGRLEARLGESRVIVALTADHGVAPCPEGRAGALRVSTDAVRRRLEAALANALGTGHWVDDFVGFDVWLDRSGPESARVDAAAIAALSAEAGIARVYGRSELAGGGPADPYLAMMRASWRVDRGGDLRILVREGSLLTGLTTGSDHGTPYAHDTHVALVIRAPGIAPGRRGERVDPTRLAPTLASLLGVPSPTDLPVTPLPGTGR